MQITAAVLRTKAQPFTLETVELDTPRADEVLVRMVATGICHTDLSMRDTPFTLPVVLGHEGAGVVEQVGAQVTKVKPGDHVVLTFSSCGNCPNCQRGQPAYCAHAFDSTFTGKRADGSTTLQRGAKPFTAASLVNLPLPPMPWPGNAMSSRCGRMRHWRSWGRWGVAFKPGPAR